MQNLCTILCHFDKFGLIQEKLISMSIESQSANIQRVPKETIDLNEEDSLKILSIVEKFEDLDDVQQVFHNLNITEKIIEKFNHET